MKKYYIIEITFNFGTVYYNSVHQDNTTENKEAAEGFVTYEEAKNALYNFLLPYIEKQNWTDHKINIVEYID